MTDRYSRSTTQRVWRLWLSRHASELHEAGIALAITEDVDNWFYYIDHGNYPGAGGTALLAVEDLTPDQRLQLCCTLEAMAAEMDIRPHVLALLQHELGR